MEFLVFSPPPSTSAPAPLDPSLPPPHPSLSPRPVPAPHNPYYPPPLPPAHQHGYTHSPNGHPSPTPATALPYFHITNADSEPDPFAYPPAFPHGLAPRIGESSPLANSAAYPFPVMPARLALPNRPAIPSVDRHRPMQPQSLGSSGQAGPSRAGRAVQGEALHAMRDLEEDLSRSVGLDVDGWAEVLQAWSTPGARVGLLLSSDGKAEEYDFHAVMLAPFSIALQHAGLQAQSLRVRETTEHSIIFGPCSRPAPAARPQPPSLPNEAGSGILLEADDFRWTFEYADGLEVRWEGTMSVVWADTAVGGVYEGDGVEGQAGGTEGGLAGRRLRVERIEVVVHEFSVRSGGGRGSEAIGKWGLPDEVLEVLKMIESSERFEPIRREAEQLDSDYDVAFERYIDQLDPDELVWEGDSGDEDGGSFPETDSDAEDGEGRGDPVPAGDADVKQVAADTAVQSRMEVEGDMAA